MIRPRKSESEKAPAVKPSQEDIDEFGEDKKEKAANTSVVSGAKTGKVIPSLFYFCNIFIHFSGEGEAFPRAAVQAYHEKPHPTHEKSPNMKPNIIQQPRKC